MKNFEKEKAVCVCGMEHDLSLCCVWVKRKRLSFLGLGRTKKSCYYSILYIRDEGRKPSMMGKPSPSKRKGTDNLDGTGTK